MYERRRATREEADVNVGKTLFGFSALLETAPAHERAWLRGAEGEEQVARRLAKHLGDAALLLHDRRMPRSRTNIDHIAVAPSGVWVIDAKRYGGRIAVSKPLFGEAKLTISGRNKSRLADGLARQVDAVGVAQCPKLGVALRVDGPSRFVDADLPAIGTLTFRGYPLLSPRRLAGRIKKRGGAEPALLQAVAAQLSARFPAA